MTNVRSMVVLQSFNSSTQHGHVTQELGDLLKVPAHVGREEESEPRSQCAPPGVLAFSATPAAALPTFVLLHPVTKSFPFLF